MNKICPRCGAHVAKDASVCPACHHSFQQKTQPVMDEDRWCESCGSPIPPSHDACPVCGMPVEGAFDEIPDKDESVGAIVQGEVVVPEPDNAALESAIPPSPRKGERDSSLGDKRHRARLLMIAALVAFVLVGGTTLYITRPWDPDAYVTHSRVDADTSMEGFPGEKSYLSAQDRTKEDEFQSALDQQRSTLDATNKRLGELAGQVKASKDELQKVAELDDSDMDERCAGAKAVQIELEEIEKSLRALEAADDELAKRRDELLVHTSYLEGAATLVAVAWDAAVEERNDALGTTIDVSMILEGGSGTRSFDEWFELFSNAHKE